MALPEFPERPSSTAIGLMTDIENYLQAVLTNGAPAVNPAVEMQIWQRGTGARPARP